MKESILRQVDLNDGLAVTLAMLNAYPFSLREVIVKFSSLD